MPRSEIGTLGIVKTSKLQGCLQCFKWQLAQPKLDSDRVNRNNGKGKTKPELSLPHNPEVDYQKNDLFSICSSNQQPPPTGHLVSHWTSLQQMKPPVSSQTILTHMLPPATPNFQVVLVPRLPHAAMLQPVFIKWTKISPTLCCSLYPRPQKNLEVLIT